MAALTKFTDVGTTAVPATQLRASYPIDGDATAIIYSQDFTIPFANYAAPTIGSANGDVGTAYCVGDSELQDLGGGMARYTRTWATVPANRSEYSTFAFTFPGLYGDYAPPYSQYWTTDPGDGRDPRTESVTTRIYHEYFLCDTGQTYTTPADIPIIEAFRVKLSGNDDASMPYCLPAGDFPADTVPTKEDYQASIAAEDEIVVQDSTIERYAGKIYVRRTAYAKAI